MRDTFQIFAAYRQVLPTELLTFIRFSASQLQQNKTKQFYMKDFLMFFFIIYF